ncbi:MAG: glutamate 5-kinase [Gammaproteobacteria bacterium]
MVGSTASNTIEDWFQTGRRVVIKVGSSLLTDTATGSLRERWLRTIVRDIGALHKTGTQVVLVASGAVALGRSALSLGAGPLRLDESQAAAAAGQVLLANAFQTAFATLNLPVAQVLLTYHDTENRRRHLNARRTLQTLLDVGAVPVVNENDTVATDELRYGDNDRLAARVAQMIDAQMLVLLSDVDGLYDANPTLEPTAQHVEQVSEITDEVLAMAGDSVSGVGTGGMRTKVLAARIAAAAGCGVVLGDGRADHPLATLRAGGRCTRFLPHGTPASARKRWIAGSLERRGVVHIDHGAASALRAGKSLLSAGVLRVEGHFERGDTVTVKDAEGRDLAVGLCAYDCAEAQKIVGLRSVDIEARLGYRGRAAMVHRDDLVMVERADD